MTNERGRLVYPLRSPDDSVARGERTDRTAELHLRSADEAARRGEYDRAVAEYTYCIQLNPTRLEAFAGRGDVLRILGRSDAAIADYTAYLDARPTDSQVLVNRGQLYALAGLPRLAATDFGAALAVKPDDPVVRLSRGQALARLKEYGDALADFTRVIQLTPGNAFAYFERGTTHLLSGDPAAAVADLTRAVQLNPFLGLALVKRAAAHVQLGHEDRAVADLTEAIRLDPLNPELYIARAEVPGRATTPAGLADLDEAVRLDPAAPEWRARRAVAYLAAGEPKRAEGDLTAALELEPDTVAWLCARGEARVRMGDYDAALADYVEAAKLAPTDGAVYLGPGTIYAARGDFSLALPYLDKAIALSPELSEAHFQRARCNARLDQVDDAIEDVSQSLALAPDSVLPRRLRAELYLKVGRADDAYADLAQLVNRAPDDPVVYHLRGRLEARRGRNEAAIADLTTALKLDPKYSEALAHRAGVYRAMAMHKEALADLTSAVQQDPKYAAEYLVQLGIVRGARGEFNGAIADFIVALQLDPTNKNALRAKELVCQLRDSHGSPEEDSADRDRDRNAAVESGFAGKLGSARGRSWRSTASLDALPTTLKALTGTSRRGSSRSEMVGVVLVPEQDDNLGMGGSTEFTLADEVASRPTSEATENTEDPDDMTLDIEPMRREVTVEELERPKPWVPPVAAPPSVRKKAPTATKLAQSKPAKPSPPPEAEHERESAELPAPPKHESVPAIKPAINPLAPTASVKTAAVSKPATTKSARRKRIDDDDDGQGRFRQLINSKWGQRILLPLGFLAVSYFVYDTFFGGPSLESAVARGKDAPYPVPPENVFASTDQYWNACLKENGAGGKKYAEQYVELTGRVRKVVPEKGVVILESPSPTHGISCSFPSKEDVAGVKPGDQVTIQGEAGGAARQNQDLQVGICKLRKK